MTIRAALAVLVALAVPAASQPVPFSLGGSQEDVGFRIDANANGTLAIGGTTFGGYDPGDGATIPGGGSLDGFAAVYGPDHSFYTVVPIGPPGPSAVDAVFDVAAGPNGALAVVGQVGEVVDLDPGAGQTLIEAPGLAVYVFLAVYDNLGHLDYGFALPGFDFEQRAYVDFDEDGNVYLLGSVSSETDLDPSDGEALVDGFRSATLVSYTPAGAFRWGFAIEGAQYRARGLSVEGTHVAITGNLISGSVDVDPGPAVREIEGAAISDWLTAVYTTDGDLETAFAVGGSAFGGVSDVAVDASGGVVLVGTIDRVADFDPGTRERLLDPAGTGSGGLGVVAAYSASAGLRYAYPLGTTRPRGVATLNGRVVWTGHFDAPFDADPGAEERVLTPVGTGYDVVTVSLGRLGELEWASPISGPGGGDNGLGVTFGSQGRTSITGRFSGTVDTDPGPGVVPLESTSAFDYDAFVVTYDRDGALAARPVPVDGGPSSATRLTVGPSPSRGQARVRLAGPLATTRVAIYDALGRQVSVLHDGLVGPGGLDVGTPRLAPGVYTVHATGGASARLVVVR